MKNEKKLFKRNYFFSLLAFFSQLETNYYAILLVAFTQGIVGLSDLALNYLYKDDLKLNPSQVAYINSLAYIPWVIKPVFGLTSDSFPIFGYRRKSYLFIFGSISIISWVMMAFYVTTVKHVIIFVIVNQSANSFCNVIGEALIVEMSRKQSINNKEAAANNVSLFVLIKSFGVLLTASSSGSLLKYIHKRKVFLITSFFPLMIVFSAFLLKEQPFNSSSSDSNSDNNSLQYTFQPFQDNCDNESIDKEYDTIPHENKSNKSPQLRDQLHLFWSVIKKKEIYHPVVFIFLFMMPPNYTDSMFFFYTNHLSFSSIIMGRLKLMYGISALLGVWLYNAYLKSINFKHILYGSTLLSMAFNLFTVILVLRINLSFGISDYFFCIASDSISTALAEINMMPILVLACNICPKNIEGTIYAFLLSIVNFGSLFANQFGSYLNYFLNITESKFDNLIWLVIISNLCYLIPLPLLFLINEDTYTKFKDYADEDADPEVQAKLIK